jgi:hypothetical protein
MSAAMPPRRFPPPWTIVRDVSQRLIITVPHNKAGIVFLEDEAGRRSAARLLTKDECRQLALISPRSICPSAFELIYLIGMS